jgi:hypothetical protein
MSGSVGGLTASHNRGGAYFRNRAIPVNPNTSQQAIVRGLMATFSTAWSGTLTQVQRDAWDLYAANVFLPDPLGVPRNVGGIGMFNRSNISRIQAGDPLQIVAPSTFDLGTFSDPSFGAPNATADTMALTFVNTDAWANEDDSSMLVYASRPQNPGVNFFDGPYRFAHRVEGDSITPPTSPATVNLPFPVVAGQKVFFYVRVTRADGRLSGKFPGSGVAV